MVRHSNVSPGIRSTPTLRFQCKKDNFNNICTSEQFNSNGVVIHVQINTA